VLAALVPFFLFGIFENFHGGMLRRVDTSFRAVLGDDRRDAPPAPQYSPQPSDNR
jgi:hypothetical protein